MLYSPFDYMKEILLHKRDNYRNIDNTETTFEKELLANYGDYELVTLFFGVMFLIPSFGIAFTKFYYLVPIPLIASFFFIALMVKGAYIIFNVKNARIRNKLHEDYERVKQASYEEQTNHKYEHSDDVFGGDSSEKANLLYRLGLTSDASKEETRKRYRSLAKKYHPDAHGDNSKMQKLNELMEQLNNIYKLEKRAS